MACLTGQVSKQKCLCRVYACAYQRQMQHLGVDDLLIVCCSPVRGGQRAASSRDVSPDRRRNRGSAEQVWWLLPPDSECLATSSTSLAEASLFQASRVVAGACLYDSAATGYLLSCGFVCHYRRGEKARALRLQSTRLRLPRSSRLRMVLLAPWHLPVPRRPQRSLWPLLPRFVNICFCSVQGGAVKC